MPPFEGLKNTYHSRPDRNPEEFADLVTRTEQGEFNAYRAVWGGEYEDAVLFVPSGSSVVAAKRAYEEMADENYIVLPITSQQARDRITAAQEKREEERIASLPKPDPIYDTNGYADFLKKQRQEELQRPGLVRRVLGRLSLTS